jgi:Peptidase inhibitor family I36
MSARRSAVFSVAASAAVLAGGLLAATPASASYTDCPAGKACTWTSNDWPGSPNASFSQSIAQYGSSDNRTNSVANNGNSSIARFYDYFNYGGDSFGLNNPVRGGSSRDANLSNGTDGHEGVNWANRISSAKFV